MQRWTDREKGVHTNCLTFLAYAIRTPVKKLQKGREKRNEEGRGEEKRI